LIEIKAHNYSIEGKETMDNLENIRDGMEVYAGDQLIGYVESVKRNKIKVNGEDIPDSEIARVDQNRVYLAGSNYAVGNYQQGQYVEGQQGEIRVPIVEERLNVSKQQAELGQVGLNKRVIEEQQNVPVELMREDVYVEQQATAERPLEPGELERAFQEETIRVPVRGEQAVVNKEAVVTGEVVVRKDQHTEQQQVTGTTRRVEVQVDKNYDKLRSNFQQNWQQNYANKGRTWEQDETNYQYGYAAGANQQYQGQSWDKLEPTLRQSYISQYGGDDSRWQQLREEVRTGFEGARNAGNR